MDPLLEVEDLSTRGESQWQQGADGGVADALWLLIAVTRILRSAGTGSRADALP